MNIKVNPEFAVGLQILPEGPKQAILWLFGVNPDKFSKKISSADGKFCLVQIRDRIWVKMRFLFLHQIS
jgi:hypothetical protein